MLLADDKGAELIVAVGTHATLVEFLDKGRSGMASTFLTRLRVGGKLVDAKGVSRLYRHRISNLQLALLVARRAARPRRRAGVDRRGADASSACSAPASTTSRRGSSGLVRMTSRPHPAPGPGPSPGTYSTETSHGDRLPLPHRLADLGVPGPRRRHRARRRPAQGDDRRHPHRPGRAAARRRRTRCAPSSTTTTGALQDAETYIDAAGPQLLDGVADRPSRRRRRARRGATSRPRTALDERLEQSGRDRHGARHAHGHVDRPGRAHASGRRSSATCSRTSTRCPADDAGVEAELASALVQALVTRRPGNPDVLSDDASVLLELPRRRATSDSPLVTVADPVTVPADAIVVLARRRRGAGATARRPPPAPADVRRRAQLAVLSAAQELLDGRGARRRTARRGQPHGRDPRRRRPRRDARRPCPATEVVTGQINVPLALADRIAGVNGHYGFGDGRDAAAAPPSSCRRSTARRGCPRARTRPPGPTGDGRACSRRARSPGSVGERRDLRRPRRRSTRRRPAVRRAGPARTTAASPSACSRARRSPPGSSPAGSSVRRPTRGAAALTVATAAGAAFGLVDDLGEDTERRGARVCAGTSARWRAGRSRRAGSRCSASARARSWRPRSRRPGTGPTARRRSAVGWLADVGASGALIASSANLRQPARPAAGPRPQGGRRSSRPRWRLGPGAGAGAARRGARRGRVPRWTRTSPRPTCSATAARTRSARRSARRSCCQRAPTGPARRARRRRRR